MSHRPESRPRRRVWVTVALIATAAAAAAPIVPGGFAARALAATAPAAPAAVSTLTAEQVVAKYLAARGGLKKIRAVQSVRMTGRMTGGARPEAVVVRELKRPLKSRIEVTAQGTTGVFASDGTNGFKMSPVDGDVAPVALPAEAVAEAAEQADIEGPLVDWQAKGHRIELAGRETVGTHDAYKIKMTLKSGGVRYEYIDVKSFDRVRADSMRTIKGVPTKVMMTFDDYQKTSGLSFPHRVEVEIEGRPQKLSVVVDKVEINPAIDDARFVMPAVKP